MTEKVFTSDQPAAFEAMLWARTGEQHLSVETATESASLSQALREILKASIRVTTPDDPMIEKTNIPIYEISALLDGGNTVNQVMEDYPTLTRAQIEEAQEYAQKRPNMGRKYPPVSFKRFLTQTGFSKIKA